LGTTISLCSLRPANCRMDSIEAMHQNRDPLVKKAGLSSLARVFRNPSSKIVEEVTSECVKWGLDCFTSPPTQYRLYERR